MAVARGGSGVHTLCPALVVVRAITDATTHFSPPLTDTTEENPNVKEFIRILK